MKQALRNFGLTVRYLIFHCIFWIVLFAIQRLIFIGINSDKAFDTPITQLCLSLVHGLIFDVSIVGYLTLLYCIVIALLSPWVRLGRILKCINVATAIISSVVVFVLPLNAEIYSHWGFHYDATSIAITTLDTIDTFTIIASIIIDGLIIIGNLVILQALTSRWVKVNEKPADTNQGRIANVMLMIVLGGLMIIPIRGGTGIAPLSNSRAFFSDYQFANHAAMNPVWNFIYSMKRLKAASTTYHYMDDDTAAAIFAEMNNESGEYQHFFKTNRPNIVYILLESFSAHAIEYLGGENATPNIKKLLKEGIAFNNIMAASDRSGKGLVAAICGYPVQPTVSVIQYPKKLRNLTFLPQTLRNSGYEDQTFIYGGDLNFNNFNVLVNMAGFKNVITQFDFEESQWGDKWGAHDEYAFERLLETIEEQKEPFFDFMFTLSSHEPFTVPMKKVLDNPYLNSVYYTDMCLGHFIEKAKERPWWNNTVVILMADHGHPGPANVGMTDKKRFNIPLIITGGAINVQDTIVKKYGTQTDVAKTLLRQLDIDAEEYTLSKNLLDEGIGGYSFFDFNDGFGFANDSVYQVYDNQGNKWLRLDNPNDTLSGKVILQMMSNDYKKR